MSAALRFAGHAFAAGSSRREPAMFEMRELVTGNRVELLDETRNSICSANLNELRIDPPLGSAPRKLWFPDGTVFETEAHDAVETLTGETRGSLLHRYERFSPHLIAVIAACVLIGLIIWRFGLDLLVAAAIAATPVAVIEQIDVGTMETIDYTIAEPSGLSDADRARVLQIFDRLIGKLPADMQERHDFKLLFRDLPGMGPNAFALPGGTMVMTDAFVEDFGTPDIIASVLGHEIGHVVEEHGLQRLYRSLAIFVLITLLAGDVGPVLEDIVLEGQLLLSLSFDRDQERSADVFGMTLAHRANYDPSGLKTFFERLSEEYGDSTPQWMSTHPSNADRIRAIETFVEGL